MTLTESFKPIKFVSVTTKQLEKLLIRTDFWWLRIKRKRASIFYQRFSNDPSIGKVYSFLTSSAKLHFSQLKVIGVWKGQCVNNIVAKEGPISSVHVTQGSYSLMTSFCRSFNLQILAHCGVSAVTQWRQNILFKTKSIFYNSGFVCHIRFTSVWNNLWECTKIFFQLQVWKRN